MLAKHGYVIMFMDGGPPKILVVTLERHKTVLIC